MSQYRTALARLASRERTVAILQIQCGVLAAMQILYTALCAWFLFTVHPDLAKWSLAGFALSVFIAAWISLSTRPLYTVLTICVLLGLSDSAVNGREIDWLSIAGTACNGLLIYIARLRIPTFARILTERIRDATERMPPLETSSRSQNRLAQFALKSLTIVLAIGFVAYSTTFVLASIFSSMMPVLRSDARWRRFAIDANNQFWPPAWLLVTLVALAVLLVHWEWRRIDPEQANIAIRSDNLRWQYSDLRRILRSRRKMLVQSGNSNDSAPQERLR